MNDADKIVNSIYNLTVTIAVGLGLIAGSILAAWLLK